MPMPRMGENSSVPLEESRSGLFGEFIGTMRSQAVICLLAAESFFDVGFQLVDDFVNSFSVALVIHRGGPSSVGCRLNDPSNPIATPTSVSTIG